MESRRASSTIAGEGSRPTIVKVQSGLVARMKGRIFSTKYRTPSMLASQSIEPVKTSPEGRRDAEGGEKYSRSTPVAITRGRSIPNRSRMAIGIGIGNGHYTFHGPADQAFGSQHAFRLKAEIPAAKRIRCVPGMTSPNHGFQVVLEQHTLAEIRKIGSWKHEVAHDAVERPGVEKLADGCSGRRTIRSGK